MFDNDNPLMVFDLPQELSSIIKVIGVGGGGGNAVNHMYENGISDVNFIVCNTDKQALDISPVPNKIQLGKALTEGRGAGMDPEKGKSATLESVDDIRTFLDSGTRMVFITACLGKGTGTGGAPVIARLAREMGILTVALVTTPFSAEGPKRFAQAENGIQDLKPNVDALIMISNDKLREIYGNLKLTEAFAQANNVLLNAARGIAEIISTKAKINVDFEDVNTVMRDSGVALMGVGIAEGDNRALNAVEMALTSPLLNDNHIKGARNVLINITSGEDEITIDELNVIIEYVQREAGFETNIIWGQSTNEALNNKLSVTIIATGFEAKPAQRISAYIPIAQSQSNPTVKSAEAMPTTRLRETKKVEPVINHIINPVQQPTFFDLDEKQVTQALPANINIDATVINENTTIAEDEDFKVIKKDIVDAEKEALDKTTITDGRILKLKSLSHPLRHDSAYYEDLERQPAYMRKQMDLKDYAGSGDNQQSKYILSKNDTTGDVELRTDNGFLHGQNRVD